MTPSVNDTSGSLGHNDASCRVLKQWRNPRNGVKAADGTRAEMQALLATIPHELSSYLQTQNGERLIFDLHKIYLQLGQCPEYIFADPTTGETVREIMGDAPRTQQHVDLFSSFSRPIRKGK